MPKTSPQDRPVVRERGSGMMPENSFRLWVWQVRQVVCNSLILLTPLCLRQVRQVVSKSLILLAIGCRRCCPPYPYTCCARFESGAHDTNQSIGSVEV